MYTSPPQKPLIIYDVLQYMYPSSGVIRTYTELYDYVCFIFKSHVTMLSHFFSLTGYFRLFTCTPCKLGWMKHTYTEKKLTVTAGFTGNEQWSAPLSLLGELTSWTLCSMYMYIVSTMCLFLFFLCQTNNITSHFWVFLLYVSWK